jgi:hypothetical protein
VVVQKGGSYPCRSKIEAGLTRTRSGFAGGVAREAINEAFCRRPSVGRLEECQTRRGRTWTTWRQPGKGRKGRAGWASLKLPSGIASGADRPFHRRDPGTAICTFTPAVHFAAWAAACVNHLELLMAATPAAQTDVVRGGRWFWGGVRHGLFSSSACRSGCAAVAGVLGLGFCSPLGSKVASRKSRGFDGRLPPAPRRTFCLDARPSVPGSPLEKHAGAVRSIGSICGPSRQKTGRRAPQC